MKKIILVSLFVTHSFSFYISGVGTKSCISFTNEKDNIMREFYYQFVYGYLAGSKTDLKNIEDEDILLYIKGYCEKNPLDSFINSAAVLEKEIKSK